MKRIITELEGGCKLLLQCPDVADASAFRTKPNQGKERRSFQLPELPDIPHRPTRGSDDKEKKKRETQKPPTTPVATGDTNTNVLFAPWLWSLPELELPGVRTPGDLRADTSGRMKNPSGKALRHAGRLTVGVEAMDLLGDLLQHVNSDDIRTAAELGQYLWDRYANYIPEAAEFIAELVSDVAQEHWDDALAKATYLTPAPAMFKVAEEVPESILKLADIPVPPEPGPFTLFSEGLNDIAEKGLVETINDRWDQLVQDVTANTEPLVDALGDIGETVENAFSEGVDTVRGWLGL